ncbi:MAG: hypothetical protein ACJAZO_000190 [Myxococcota bacterium]
MSEAPESKDESLSPAQRKALIQALVKVMRDEERKAERVKQLRERSLKR